MNKPQEKNKSPEVKKSQKANNPQGTAIKYQPKHHQPKHLKYMTESHHTTISREGMKFLSFIIFLLSVSIALPSCRIYSFKDVSIPPQVKSIHISYIENRARLVNPQLAPQLNDKLRQKINQQASKLAQRETSDADYDVSGTITDYNYTTSGISQQQASSNRLNVTVHLVFKNHLDPTGKTVAPADFEADVTRNFDFSAQLSIQDAEAQLLPTIVSNMTDEIFNKLFSNW